MFYRRDHQASLSGFQVTGNKSICNFVTESILDNWMWDRFGHENFTPGRKRIELLYKRHKEMISGFSPKIVTVAGTNGKGETAMLLERILESSGITTALWSSPHILSLTERFRFDGEDISGEKLGELFESTYKKNGNRAICTYYEFLFQVFLELVNERRPQVLILEVGLGGRLDAVNVLDSDIALLTSISRDHEKILGNGYRKILMEKIQVARAGKMLISTLELSYLRKISEDYCHENRIQYLDLFSVGDVTRQMSYVERNRKLAFAALTNLFCGLVPSVDATHFSRHRILKWNGGELVFVGAHNLDGFRKLHELLMSGRDFSNKIDRTLIGFSNRPVPEIMAILKIVFRNGNSWGKIRLCDFDHPKACDIAHIVQEAQIKLSFDDNFGRIMDEFGVIEFERKWKAFLAHLDIQGRTILVTGSYYFIGEVQKYVLEKDKSVS